MSDNRKHQPEPRLMRLYLRHCAVGFGLSAVFVALLLYYDIAGLGHLIAGSDVGPMALFLLWFFNGTVFGSVQFAIVVMSQAEPDDRHDNDHKGGGTGAPVFVPARQQKRSKF